MIVLDAGKRRDLTITIDGRTLTKVEAETLRRGFLDFYLSIAQSGKSVDEVDFDLEALTSLALIMIGTPDFD